MKPETEQALRGIGDTIKRCIPPGVCFVLFLQSSEGAHYLSNGDRGGVLDALEEWLRKTSVALQKKKPETSAAVDTRLELERTCAKIGKAFAGVSALTLFLFTFGETGNTAYFTNVPNAREAIAEWVGERRRIS